MLGLDARGGRDEKERAWQAGVFLMSTPEQELLSAFDGHHVEGMRAALSRGHIHVNPSAASYRLTGYLKSTRDRTGWEIAFACSLRGEPCCAIQWSPPCS